MKIETPNDDKAPEQGAPADQTGSADDTQSPPAGQVLNEAGEDLHPAGKISLGAIVQAHEGTHPGFDPAIHAVTDDGTPKRRADGSYALKRGRKSGQANSLPPKGGATATPQNSQAVSADPVVTGPVRIAPDEAARQSANLVINMAVWICGEEIGKPNDKAESEGLKISFVNYYEARGVPNIPPELGLFAALGSYIVPRFRQSEKARGLIERAVIYVRQKLGK